MHRPQTHGSLRLAVGYIPAPHRGYKEPRVESSAVVLTTGGQWLTPPTIRVNWCSSAAPEIAALGAQAIHLDHQLQMWENGIGTADLLPDIKKPDSPSEVVMHERMKWISVHLLHPFAIGVVSSLVVAWLAFAWFKQDFRSIVDKSLDIINLDLALSELEKASEYTLDFGDFQASAHASPSEALQACTTGMQRTEKTLGDVLARCDTLLAAYENLPISDRPVKLYGSELVASPRGRFRTDLEDLRLRILGLHKEIGESKRGVTAIRALVDQREYEQFQSVNEEFNRMANSIEDARRMLAERRDAFCEALAAFGAN
jgi:hypothetical protein